jgi:hypothetical protein
VNQPKPERVHDVYEYWNQAPPEPSARLVYWEQQVEAGWRPNRRIRSFGYAESAEWFGVYVWEWRNVLWPLIEKKSEVACQIEEPSDA